jgi:hypothetical protein
LAFNYSLPISELVQVADDWISIHQDTLQAVLGDCLTQARSRTDVDACLMGLAVEAQTQATAACVALGPLLAQSVEALVDMIR